MAHGTGLEAVSSSVMCVCVYMREASVCLQDWVHVPQQWFACGLLSAPAGET